MPIGKVTETINNTNVKKPFSGLKTNAKQMIHWDGSAVVIRMTRVQNEGKATSGSPDLAAIQSFCGQHDKSHFATPM